MSRILSLYGEKKKPVLYVSGNHEGYEHPYGISPRLRAGDKFPVMRANAGIPADHNLTIYEACLLYGPESSERALLPAQHGWPGGLTGQCLWERLWKSVKYEEVYLLGS